MAPAPQIAAPSLARTQGSFAALALALAFVSCAPGSESGTGKPTLWSGPWWPFATASPPNTTLNLYAAGEAMEKYWSYLQKTRDPNALAHETSAVEVERTGHMCTNHGECNCGHCQAFTAASLMEPEPAATITKTIVWQEDATGLMVFTEPGPGGSLPNEHTFSTVLLTNAARVRREFVSFDTGHQKGLLTELWFRRGTDEMRGIAEGATPYVSVPGFPRHPLTPAEYDSALAWVKGGAGSDIFSSDDISHHPIYSYRKTWRDSVDQQRVTHRLFTAEVQYVDYAARNYLGRLLMPVTYRYRIPLANGRPADAGEWRGVRPGTIYRLDGTHEAGNRQVTEACVREILRGTETILIRTPDDFRAWPCT